MPLWVGIRPKWRLGLGRNMGLQNAHETWSVFLFRWFFVAGKSIELTRGTFSKLCLMIMMKSMWDDFWEHDRRTHILALQLWAIQSQRGLEPKKKDLL
jgi:hypothetical protein